MKCCNKRNIERSTLFIIVFSIFINITAVNLFGQSNRREQLKKIPSPTEEINLEQIPFKIAYETYRITEGKRNWEIYMIDANGSNPVNLTNTPELDELYPHVSPDGKKICFVVDEGTNRRNKVRSVYYMNIDGTKRVEVARNARQPCWSPDGKSIAYLRGEYERYNKSEYATSGLFIYDLETKSHRQHPNRNLIHLYAICWSPDSNWFLGVVKGNTKFSDAVLAIEVNGLRVFDLERWGVKGCRPDFSPDGRQITWGETDWDLNIGNFDITPEGPRVSNIRKIASCRRNSKIYHVDFSPDNKYVIFSYGPSGGNQQVGSLAKGWDICIADLTGKWYQITEDGNHNKEPDWAPLAISDEAETNQKQ